MQFLLVLSRPLRYQPARWRANARSSSYSPRGFGDRVVTLRPRSVELPRSKRAISVSKSGSNEAVDGELGTAADSGSGSRREAQGQPEPGWIGVLGLELVKVASDEVLAEWTVDARHLQPHGVVHGGVFCSVVEACCSLGAQAAAPAGTAIVGVDNHTSFVRAVREGRLSARATPLHVGRRAQLWECSIVDAAGRLIATGRLRLMTASGSTSERDAR